MMRPPPLTSRPLIPQEFKGNRDEASLVKLLSECQQESSRLLYENQELEKQEDRILTLENTINELNLELAKKNSELVAIKKKFDTNQQDIMTGKSRSTLLKIIAGFALCGRRIDIRLERLKGVSGLVCDFERIGIKVDQKTLSSYLKESSGYLDY